MKDYFKWIDKEFRAKEIMERKNKYVQDVPKGKLINKIPAMRSYVITILRSKV